MVRQSHHRLRHRLTSTVQVCIGIPVCRPLFRNWFNIWTSRSGSNPGPYTRDMTGSNLNFMMRTIGGTNYSVRVGLKTPEPLGGGSSSFGPGRIGYETSGTEQSGGGKDYDDNDDNSVEMILGPELKKSQTRNGHGRGWSDGEGRGDIWVKSEVVVKSTAR